LFKISKTPIEVKASWLKGRVTESGSWKGGVIVTFDMPSVTLQLEDNKYRAIRCTCKHHSIHGGLVHNNIRCQYVEAAEAAYFTP
jgi:hypothetical protein